MTRFAVLLAGRARATDRLRAAVAGRRIVAADGGIAHASPLGVVPELWVGDFDSVPAGLPETLLATEREVFPRGKDATDGELALDAAIARGARDVLLVGALGGARSDHAVSNILLALRHAAQGLSIGLFDGVERCRPLGPEPLTVAAVPGQIFSILLFSEVEGLTVRGARWPLDRADLPFGSILTQSNEALGPIEVSVDRGRAAILLQETG